MRLLAFQGVRFGETPGRDAGDLAAPPFDQIDDSLRQQLHQIPHHFSLLTKPTPEHDETPEAAAARIHGDWLSSGTAIEEETPALYLNEILLNDGGSRLSIVGLVEIQPGAVRPHERTVDKTISERLGLLRQTQTDLEPIMLLCNEPGTLESSMAEDWDSNPVLVEHVDAAGNRHRLYRIDDPARILHYQQFLEPITGLIADGHHRYKTARLYAEETSAKAGSAAGAKLVFLASLRSTSLTIDPIHRLLPGALDFEKAAGLIENRQIANGQSGSEVAEAVARARQPALGIMRAGRSPEIWRLDPTAVRQAAGSDVPDLAVVLLHAGVLPMTGLDDSAATDGTIKYRSNPDVLWNEVSRSGDTGVILPPMTAQGFADALDKMDLLPPKSTRFLPKLASGLVWCRHGCDVSG